MLCSCSSPSADPRGYPPHTADFAPKSHTAASSRCCLQNNQKACTLCCGGEICVSTNRPSLKTSPRAPSPGPVPVPVSVLLRGCLWCSLALVTSALCFQEASTTLTTKRQKKVTADVWVSVFLAVLQGHVYLC